MKHLIIFLVLATLLPITQAEARDTYVQGYTKRDGTYVQGYHRSSPDGNTWNNYSTQGNTNPYTGQQGTVNPYRSESFGSGYGSGYSNSNSSGRNS